MTKLAVAAVALVGLTACTAEQWASLTPDQQAAVIAAGPPTCHRAVDIYWPPDSRTWAHRIVTRESGGNPTAQNSRSTAAGCMQLLRIHAWRYDAVGCSWSDRYDARCNVLAALHLYREQGAAPWN